MERSSGALVTAVVLFANTLARPAGAEDAMWATVRINGSVLQQPSLLQRDGGGQILARSADVAAWGLPALAGITERIDSGGDLVRLRSRPGFDASLDEAQYLLELTVAPWLFDTQVFQTAEPRDPLQAAPLAAMVDYDIYGTSESDYSAALAASVASGRVSMMSTWQVGQVAGGGLQRLETTLRLSMPERMSVLSVGDATSTGMAATRAVRFAGVQWMSDFATQPEFRPYALPSVQGTAVVPSTVDVFVNSNFLASHDVAPGPFTVRDVPVPLGNGEVELRIHDAIGREQRVSSRFLASLQLLRPGLTAWSSEVGLLRRDFGIRESRYGPAFGALSLRRGLGPGTTLAAGAEFLRRRAALRVEAVQRISHSDLVSAGVAGSRAGGRTGMAGELSWQHRRRLHEWSTELHVVDGRYTDVSRVGDGRYRFELASQFSIRARPGASFSLAHVIRGGRGLDTAEVVTLTASLGPVAGGSVQAYFSRNTTRSGGIETGLHYTLAIGRTTAAAGISRSGKRTGASIRAGRSTDRRTGWGWDALANTGSNDYRMLRAELRTRGGTGEVQLLSFGPKTTLATVWRGGLLLHPGGVQMAPELGDSAAVIELPGIARVAVQHDGQPVGRTNSRGLLITPELRSYELNRIQVVADEIPISAWIDMDTLQLRPYSRNVYWLKFPAASTWIEFQLVSPEGKPIPAGARVTVGDKRAVIGDAGLVVVPQMPGAALAASWGGGQCLASPAPEQWAQTGPGPVAIVCR